MKLLKFSMLAFFAISLFSCSDDKENLQTTAPDDPVVAYQQSKQVIDLTQRLASASESVVPKGFRNNGSPSSRIDNIFCDLLKNVEFPTDQTCISYSIACTADTSLLTTIEYADGCAQGGESVSGKITVLTEKPFDIHKKERINTITYEKLKIGAGEINGTTLLTRDLTNVQLADWVSKSNYTIDRPGGERLTITSTNNITLGSANFQPPFTTTNDISYTVTSSVGYKVTGITTDKLVSMSDCKIDEIQYPIKGTQTIAVTGLLGKDYSYVLDFGDGTCDGTYTVKDKSDETVRTFNQKDDTEVK